MLKKIIMRIVVYKIPEQEKILYNLGFILEKICKTNQVSVLCDVENVEFVDKVLWTFSSNSFLPHDIAIDDFEKNKKQPVLICVKKEQIKTNVVCVFNINDLNDFLENVNITTIIYITQNQNDILKIKQNIIADNFLIDVFVKNNKKWEKE